MTTTRTPVLGNNQQERIAHFLKRRQLNEQMVALLKEIKDEHDLKRGEVTTAQNATYDAIIESLAKSLQEGWVTTERVTGILDAAEIAGRQHVLLFTVPDDIVDELEATLQQPAILNTDGVQLDEFWEIPLGAYTRILEADASAIVSKIICPRFYWLSEERQPTEDRIEVIKQRERERSTIIIKLNKGSKLLQFRVPVREKAPNADTGKSVYDFIVEMVTAQLGDAGMALFNRLRPFPIQDAYQKLIDNREDFQLLTDTPENQHFKSSMSHKGTSATITDIRDFEQWGFAEGFARTSLRGNWKIADEGMIDVRMHSEKIKTGTAMSRNVTRLFFPRPCSDKDVEHVIRRISEHLP
ncbi:MAG: hypothetical protein ACYC0X_15530 [Pirellulaceae bacterium]